LRNRSFYLVAKEAQVQAKAAVRLTTVSKKNSLAHLKELMKNCLKKSEVDVSGDPEKLSYIGWGPRAASQPTDIPNQPSNLAVNNVTRGALSLVWEKPNSGSIVRNYIIERRNQQEDEQFSRWTLVATAYESSVNLKNQPRGRQLEYRVKAVNTSGQSQPSNTAAIVL
jgi:hypothetical protein